MSEKIIEYICNSFEISPLATHCVELTGCLYPTKPDKLQILVKSLKFGKEKYVELANAVIMGSPQLITYNGLNNNNERGHSLIFKNYLDISDWEVFGTSQGQGLLFDFVNPFDDKLKVSIVLKGYRSSTDKLGSR